MRLPLSMCFGLVACTALLAQPSSMGVPARTVLATPSVRVPLTKIGGFYYAEVRVNGMPFRFTLETGAGFLAVSPRLVQALGLPIDSAMGPGSRVGVVRLDSITLGDAMFAGITARVSPRFDAGEYDGLISIPLLRDVLATLDLGGATLRLEQRSLPREDAFVLPFAGLDRGGRVDVPIRVGGIELAAVLDTRSMFWLMLHDSLAPRLALEAPPREAGMARGPSLGSFALRGARIAGTLAVGAHTVARPPVILRDRGGTVLGVPFLEQYVVSIDQRNRRVQVMPRDGAAPVIAGVQPWEADSAHVSPGLRPTAEPARTAAPASSGEARAMGRGAPPAPGTRTLGFGIAMRPGGTPTVAMLAPASSAAQAGVREGDEIVEVDGTPAAALTREIVRAAVNRGALVKLVLSRDGKQLEFVIEPFVVP